MLDKKVLDKSQIFHDEEVVEGNLEGVMVIEMTTIGERLQKHDLIGILLQLESVEPLNILQKCDLLFKKSDQLLMTSDLTHIVRCPNEW